MRALLFLLHTAFTKMKMTDGAIVQRIVTFKYLSCNYGV